MPKTRKIGFIGGGNMAEAIIKGLILGGLAGPAQIIVHDIAQGRLDYLRETYAVTPAKTNTDVMAKANLVILAIKPQFLSGVLAEIGPLAKSSQIVVSIAAGVTLDSLQAVFHEPVPLVRVMPNTPALVQAGASALSRGTHTTGEQMDLVMNYFQSVGLAVEVEERLMDAVTGLSGSGPAYVFLFLEALTDAGVSLGLPRQTARLLANQTVLGSARLALEPGRHPAELKDMVTSPGGTTIAALHGLEKAGFRGLVMDAVIESARKAAELGKK